jgi:hypothetical protein
MMNFHAFGSLSQSDFVFAGGPTCESAFGVSRTVSVATKPDESVAPAVSELEKMDDSEGPSTACENNERELAGITSRAILALSVLYAGPATLDLEASGSFFSWAKRTGNARDKESKTGSALVRGFLARIIWVGLLKEISASSNLTDPLGRRYWQN